MTIEQKVKYSNSFIWLAVLAWVPYIVARVMQIDWSGIPFLIVHIVGVSGGIYFRRQASEGAPPPSAKIKRLSQASACGRCTSAWNGLPVLNAWSLPS